MKDTCERFIEKVTPLISKEDLEKAKESIERFTSGTGKLLQEKLENRAEELRGNGSYVEEFWYNGYLAPKESVVLNLNPFFVLEDDPTPARNEQVKRGASLLFCAVRFVWKLWNEELVPDMWRKTPLDMSQYVNYCTTKTLFARITKHVEPQILSSFRILQNSSQG